MTRMTDTYIQIAYNIGRNLIQSQYGIKWHAGQEEIDFFHLSKLLHI